MVTISTPLLGTLINTVTSSEAAPPWEVGIRALWRNLADRGLLLRPTESASGYAGVDGPSGGSDDDHDHPGQTDQDADQPDPGGQQPGARVRPTGRRRTDPSGPAQATVTGWSAVDPEGSLGIPGGRAGQPLLQHVRPQHDRSAVGSR